MSKSKNYYNQPTKVEITNFYEMRKGSAGWKKYSGGVNLSTAHTKAIFSDNSVKEIFTELSDQKENKYVMCIRYSGVIKDIQLGISETGNKVDKNDSLLTATRGVSEEIGYHIINGLSLQKEVQINKKNYSFYKLDLSKNDVSIVDIFDKNKTVVNKENDNKDNKCLIFIVGSYNDFTKLIPRFNKSDEEHIYSLILFPLEYVYKFNSK